MEGRMLAPRIFLPLLTLLSGAVSADEGRALPERKIAVIPLGSLDDDPGRGAQEHIYTGSKAPWYEITDGLPRFEAQPG